MGDSRVYLLRHGELEQITTDHSLVQELVDVGPAVRGGGRTTHSATSSPGRSASTRTWPSTSSRSCRSRGDRYLLCSDGLPREVNDDQIASILRRLSDPKDAARELVAQARARGGNDNITVVVVDVVDDDDQAATASAAWPTTPELVIPPGLADDEPPAEPRKSRRLRRSPPDQRASKRANPITVRVVGFAVLLAALSAAPWPPSACTPAAATSSGSPTTSSPSSEAARVACCGSSRRSSNAPTWQPTADPARPA